MSSQNSDDPRGPWLLVWGLACVAVVALFASLEIFWRRHGYTPTLVSTEELWSYQRERAEGAGPETIALVGGSRMQFGFINEAFLEERPGARIVQLAISGKPPVPTLRDLADDESFGGTVIYSIVEATMFPGWRDQQSFVDYYHLNWGPGIKYSLLISAALQQRLVFVQPRLGGPKLLESFFPGRGKRPHLPPVNYIHTRFDRRQFADYSLLTEKNIRGLIDLRIERYTKLLPEHPPAPVEEWRAFVRELVEMTSRIEARGGRVVFVKFPARGRFKELYDAYFPRTPYWDILVENVGEALHCEDMPGADELQLPDDSHLDVPSGIRFTKWIAREMAKHGDFE
jgi:hypothetical protein